jgi:hypothetical protein
MTTYTQPSLLDFLEETPKKPTSFYCENCGSISPIEDKPLHVIDQEFTRVHSPEHTKWVYHIAQKIAWDNLIASLDKYKENLITWEALIEQYQKTYKVWAQREGYLIKPVTDAGVSWSALSRTAIWPGRKTTEHWLLGPRTIRMDVGGMIRYYCLCGAEYRSDEAIRTHLRTVS